MKKLLSFMLAVIIIIGCVPSGVSASSEPIDIDKISLDDIQNILFEYFEENNLSYDPETAIFYEFVIDQLLNKTDSLLAQHPQYNLIHAYLVEYKLKVEDEYFNAITTEISSEVKASELDTKIYLLSDDFLSKTIGEIKQEVAALSVDDIPPIEMHSTSAYDGAAASTYAQKYALIYNSDYTSYGLSGGDCTNFVSQALHAGGKAFNGNGSTNEIIPTTSRWFHNRFLYDWHGNYGVYHTCVTTSWIRVSDFNTYWSKYASKSTFTTHNSLIQNCKVGDVVQAADKTTGKPYHSIIISQTDSSTYANYCGHSNDRKNKDITSISTSENKFIRFRF